MSFPLNDVVAILAKRAENLTLIHRLTADDLQRKGQHSALGEFVLGDLLADWAASDLAHTRQLLRYQLHRMVPLTLPWPTLSHHLDILQRAGLLTSRKEERFVFYTVRKEIVSDLVRLLTACC